MSVLHAEHSPTPGLATHRAALSAPMSTRRAARDLVRRLQAAGVPTIGRSQASGLGGVGRARAGGVGDIMGAPPGARAAAGDPVERRLGDARSGEMPRTRGVVGQGPALGTRDGGPGHRRPRSVHPHRPRPLPAPPAPTPPPPTPTRPPAATTCLCQARRRWGWWDCWAAGGAPSPRHAHRPVNASAARCTHVAPLHSGPTPPPRPPPTISGIPPTFPRQAPSTFMKTCCARWTARHKTTVTPGSPPSSNKSWKTPRQRLGE